VRKQNVGAPRPARAVSSASRSSTDARPAGQDPARRGSDLRPARLPRGPDGRRGRGVRGRQRHPLPILSEQAAVVLRGHVRRHPAAARRARGRRGNPGAARPEHPPHRPSHAGGPADRRTATAGVNMNRPRTIVPLELQRRWWPWLLALLALAGGAYWLRATLGERATAAVESAKRPAVPVVVAMARADDFPVYLTGLGSVVAFNTVTVKSRVDGQLINVAFREGQLVREGDLLAEVDPRPFQVQLEQAERQLARDWAQP